MKKVTEETSAGKSEARPSGLDDLIQQGARQIVQQAIEAELAALLERYDNVKTLDGRRTVIRNGYLPEREVVTAIGPAPGHREGAEGSRSLGLGREVQFEHRAALYSEVPPRVSGIALAVSTRRLDRRHERGAERAAGRRGQGSFAECGQPPEGSVGRRARPLESA